MTPRLAAAGGPVAERLHITHLRDAGAPGEHAESFGGTIALRRSRGYAPAFRAWGFPLVPIVFALVCLAIVLNQIVSDPRESLTGLALVALGLPVYYFWRRPNARD